MICAGVVMSAQVGQVVTAKMIKKVHIFYFIVIVSKLLSFERTKMFEIVIFSDPLD